MKRSPAPGSARGWIAAAALVIGLAGVACAALLAGSLGLTAAAPYEVMGLRLGDGRELVSRAHPDLRLEPVPYEDPRVGTRYALTHGSVAVLRYEGRKLERQDEREGYELTVRLTGDDRLYEVTAQVLDRSRTCAEAIAVMAERFGAPRVDERPSYALWRDPDLLGPQLELRCLGPGLYRIQLADRSLEQAYRERLKRELEPAVNEALQVLGEPSAPPPAGGPPPQLGGALGQF